MQSLVDDGRTVPAREIELAVAPDDRTAISAGEHAGIRASRRDRLQLH